MDTQKTERVIGGCIHCGYQFDESERGSGNRNSHECKRPALTIFIVKWACDDYDFCDRDGQPVEQTRSFHQTAAGVWAEVERTIAAEMKEREDAKAVNDTETVDPFIKDPDAADSTERSVIASWTDGCETYWIEKQEVGE